MKIIVANVNTSESMTEVIAAGAKRYASPRTETIAVAQDAAGGAE